MVYLLVHYQGEKAHTFIGSTNNFEKSLSEYNKNVQTCLPVLLLKFPNQRDYGIKHIRESWKRNTRGLDSRIKYGFKLAKKYGTTVYIHRINNSILNFLNDVEGEPKLVDGTFWDQF